MTQDKPRITAQDIIEASRRQKAQDLIHLAERHFTEPEPIRCKWCGSLDIMKYGSRKGVQEYICQKCGRKFIEKDAPFKRQYTVDVIGESLTDYYNGESYGEIATKLAGKGIPANESTVYRWVIRYTQKALEVLDPLKPSVSDIWAVDEVVLKVEGNIWFWDVIDEGTRFLLASHLSRSRTIGDVMIVMRRAQKRAGKNPRFIISDALGVYPDGIERIFGAEAKHIQAKGITAEINNNLIERFHGTIKGRTKVMRGFKSLDAAELILDGFLCFYNFFRPHMSLSNTTPAEVAGIRTPYKTWTDVVRADK